MNVSIVCYATCAVASFTGLDQGAQISLGLHVGSETCGKESFKPKITEINALFLFCFRNVT